MFYFMTLSFIIMPALGCFLIGLAFAKPDRWDFSWILSLIGLAAFISSFWHIARVDLWFMLSYSVGPFLMGFGFSWDLIGLALRADVVFLEVIGGYFTGHCVGIVVASSKVYAHDVSATITSFL